MPKSATRQTLDEVIAAITPTLLAAGYTKSARNFHSESSGVVRLVQVETSQLEKPDQACFTINLSVTSPKFHEAYTQKPFPKNIGSAEPVVQTTLGKLLPEGDDVWWPVEPDKVHLIIKDLGAALETHGLPFLARFPSEDALLAALEGKAPPPGFSAMRERCRAVLLAARGRKAEALQALQGMIDANQGEALTGFRDSLHDLAHRLGLVEP